MPDRIPRVTIGLPVYNGARYLDRALASLLAQTFQDFEIVISDNASTDNTADICREFASKDRRIRYFRQSENLGAASNFNRVFRLSRAEYFAWAAADDLRHETYFEKCVELLDQQLDILWCHSLSSHIGPNGELLSDSELQNVSYLTSVQSNMTPSSKESHSSRAASTPHERFEAVLLGKGGCIDSYGLIRAEALRNTRLILPYFGAEKVLMSELALRGKYAEIPEVLFFMRIHDEAVGASKTGKDQQATFSPKMSTRLIRVRLLTAYVQAVWRTSLSFSERLRCFNVVSRYLLQFNKWSSVLRKAVTGAGIGGKNAKILNSSEPVVK